MNSVDSILARLTALHPKRIDLSLGPHASGCLPRSVIPSASCHRSSMLPAPTAKAHSRFPAGDAGSGGAARARLYVAASGAVQRALSYRRAQAEGALVTDDEFSARWRNASAPTPARAITVFEITTAAALLLFSRHPADVLLLEVGLGGRLDATNVVDNPLASDHHAAFRSITSISSAIPSTRSRRKKPAFSNAACRRLSRRSRATHWP